jgi:beta-glucosidase
MCARTSNRIFRRVAPICVGMAAFALSAAAQVIPPEKVDEARIDRLIQQMTLEEKMNLIRGDVEPDYTNQGQAPC